VSRFDTVQKIITSSRFLAAMYLYWFTLQSFLLSIKPVLTADNYSLPKRIRILGLECLFMGKATINLLFRRHLRKETFLGYTVVFPNYLEFAQLFIEMFGIQEYKLKKHKSGLTIVDCGSGWGMSILYFTHMVPGARIQAVEANSQVVSYLQKNILDNHIRHVTVTTAFVSAKKGKQSFYTYQGFEGWSISNTGSADFVEKRGNFTKTLVPSVQLSELLDRSVDVLKLDIEGMEGETLVQARQVLPRVSELIIEFHPNMNRAHNSLETIRAILARAGFVVAVANTKSILNRDSGLKIIHAIYKL
jgi:FkbM family methyltransferase